MIDTTDYLLAARVVDRVLAAVAESSGSNFAPTADFRLKLAAVVMGLYQDAREDLPHERESLHRIANLLQTALNDGWGP